MRTFFNQKRELNLISKSSGDLEMDKTDGDTIRRDRDMEINMWTT